MRVEMVSVSLINKKNINTTTNEYKTGERLMGELEKEVS